MAVAGKATKYFWEMNLEAEQHEKIMHFEAVATLRYTASKDRNLSLYHYRS
jgi:hypothetical protein